jgi:uncharacterized membrane protein YdbT with pleckstrin-like domain
MGFPQRLLAPDEHLVLMLRPHVKALLAPLAVLLIAGPAAGFLIGMVPDGGASLWLRLGVAVIAALVIGRWVLWPFLVWFNTLYVVTDRRLVTRQGVLNRTGHDMPLTRLNDVKFAHNLVERVLGCGTLVVESAGEAGQLVLNDVPRVEQVQRTLYRLSDELRPASGPSEGRPGRRDVDRRAGGRPDEPFDEDFDQLVDDPDEVQTLILERRKRFDPRRGDR